MRRAARTAMTAMRALRPVLAGACGVGAKVGFMVVPLVVADTPTDAPGVAGVSAVPRIFRTRVTSGLQRGETGRAHEHTGVTGALSGGVGPGRRRVRHRVPRPR